ncbi:unnamed protein product [Trichobilharzia szidati]|nr:unnamed protein product [Trichobilharzia szidati]
MSSILLNCNFSLNICDFQTSAKLRKLSKPPFVIPNKSELELADTSNANNNNNDDQNNVNKIRKNKNLIKLKKYKKRQLKKKYSRKQLHARKLLQQNEGNTKSANHAQEEALNYLRMWHDDYNNWKFKTLEQSWLIKNALNKKMLPSSEFKMFKNYIKKLVGRAREDLLRRCSEIVENDTVTDPNDESKQCTNDTEINMETSEQQDAPQHHHHQESGPKLSRTRARKLLAILSIKSD